MTDTTTEAVERRAVRLDIQAENRRAEAVNWAPGSALAAAVLAHADALAEDAATLRALAQERDALAERSRWNIREEGGDLLICRGDHHRAEKCEWERYVPEAERDAARAVAKRLQTELRSVLGWALAEKAPLRAQEIASIRAALAAKEGT